MTTDNTSEQAAFEAWAADEGYSLARWERAAVDESYVNHATNDAWRGYQAARAASVPAEPYAWFWTDGSDQGVLTMRQDYEHHKAKYPRMTFVPVYASPPPVPAEMRLTDDAQHRIRSEASYLERLIDSIESGSNIGKLDLLGLKDAATSLRAAALSSAPDAALTPQPLPEPAPIDMVLHCPNCGEQHIDAPEQRFHDKGDGIKTWGNPPHRSHLCHGCGHIWRPADVPTNGVAEIKTKGKNDSPKLAAPVVPDGFVLVPKEPTQAMLDSAWKAMQGNISAGVTWAAMLAAAPKGGAA